MTYTVVWKKTALDRLAEIWLAASDQQEVADSADTIDALLAKEPWKQGESREKDVRVFSSRLWPCCTQFRIPIDWLKS